MKKLFVYLSWFFLFLFSWQTQALADTTTPRQPINLRTMPASPTEIVAGKPEVVEVSRGFLPILSYLTSNVVIKILVSLALVFLVIAVVFLLLAKIVERRKK